MPDPAPIVLDTHAWIWLLNGDPLARKARLGIQEAAARGAVWVPAIAVWELGMLVSKGRLTLQLPCADWVARALAAPGMQLAELSSQVALASTQLPGAFHGDPADRMIVATARERGAVLVTRDAKILAYGHAGHVRVLPA